MRPRASSQTPEIPNTQEVRQLLPWERAAMRQAVMLEKLRRRSGASTPTRQHHQTPELPPDSWNRMFPTPSRPRELEQAERTLGIDEHTTREAATEAWRRLMLEHHPDHGGQLAQAQAINQSWDLVCKARHWT